MTNAETFYARVKAICCASWGIDPHAFDTKADAGLFSWEDVQCAIEFACARDALGGVYKFLARERIERNREINEVILYNVEMAKIAKKNGDEVAFKRAQDAINEAKAKRHG